ncbi:uncharacterized protein LOC130667648 [Microplitis mediator]|uniref:uncharacterized protein LOC130667648 n=1 Tax=Microplitis mediator TaxID=375433 RepID=UPI00255674DD|nr:uncharacterized protein LOC130667648 [Microplitis mediator]XP_057325375.1 uncharacterized protein LOC130667648 [Microplitis mediator]
MDAFLLNVKSLTEKFIKSDCMCSLNYFRYEEGAKLCLCENEYRKLKNYVDYFKFLELREKTFNFGYETQPSDDMYKRSTSDFHERRRGFAMLMILEIEDKLESLNLKKIITNPTYTEIHDKVKALKSEYPIAFMYSTQVRKINNKTEIHNIKDYQMQRNITERTLITLNAYEE